MGDNLPLVDSTMRLRDGRTLAYAEYGDPTGTPVIYLHGTPGSRLLYWGASMPAAGIRLIAIDRPGYGRSDFHTNWEILDWPADVAQLADVLGIEHFAIMGISGGGPYAAACAFGLPARVTSLTLISSPAPLPIDITGNGQLPDGLDEEIVQARTTTCPDFMNWFIERYGPETPDVEAWSSNPAPWASPSDQKLAQRREVQLYLREMFSGAFQQGMMSWAYDTWLLVRPWGFDLQGIGVASRVLHGEDDLAVPIANGRYLANTLPGCRACFYPGEGHMFFFDHWDEIFATLVKEQAQVNS